MHQQYFFVFFLLNLKLKNKVFQLFNFIYNFLKLAKDLKQMFNLIYKNEKNIIFKSKF